MILAGPRSTVGGLVTDFAEQLFESETVPVAARRSARDSLSGAVALDRERRLVRMDDGPYARRVCLHSLDKAHYASYYADIVGTAMKRAYPGPLAWIELFAGPGELYVKDLAQYHAGSPVEAVSIRDPFDHYFFADLDQRCVDSLEARVGGSDKVHVRRSDANDAHLHDEIVALIPKNSLVVLYADPAGLDLHFETLEFFAKRYKHLDLLLNFPVPGIDRALSAGKAEKAARVLGHDDPLELLGPSSGRTGVSLRQWFQRKLAGLEYNHFDAELIRFQDTQTPLYDLMIASRESKAIQFFGEARKRGPRGQYGFAV